MGKPDIVVCVQQRWDQPAYLPSAYVIRYLESLTAKLAKFMQNFNIPASLYSLAG